MMTYAGKSSFRPFQNTWLHSSRPFFHKVIRVQSWHFGGGVSVRNGDPEVLEGWDSEWRSQSDPVKSLSSLGAVTPSCLLIGLLPKRWSRSTWGLHFWVVLIEKVTWTRIFFSVGSKRPTLGYVVHENSWDVCMRFGTTRYLERPQN